MSSCELCQREAGVGYVTLKRNIGMFFSRQWISTEGTMCRDCARSKWLKETLLTLFFGWWGVVSLFANLYAVLHNVAQVPLVFGIQREPDAPVRKNYLALLLVVSGALALGAGISFALAGSVDVAQYTSALGNRVRQEAGGSTTDIVYLDSVPRGAKVYMNGELKGVTPFGTDAPSGAPVDVRLELDGYQRAELTVEPGTVFKRTVVLKRLGGSARPKPAEAQAPSTNTPPPENAPELEATTPQPKALPTSEPEGAQTKRRKPLPVRF